LKKSNILIFAYGLYFQTVSAGLKFFDATTSNKEGNLTLPLCRTVNPEDKRRIIGDTFVKVADRTANDLNLTWDNLLLGQGNFTYCFFFINIYCDNYYACW
jgi:hypothetical protein